MLEQPDQPEGAAVSLRLLLACIGVGGFIATSGSLVISSSAVRFGNAAAAEETKAAQADDGPPLSAERHPPPVVNYVAPKSKAEPKHGANEALRKKKSEVRAKAKKPASPKPKAAKSKSG
jgi:hypothetical protein